MTYEGFETIEKKHRNTINSIQYNALRIIFKKDRRFGNKNLLELAKAQTVSDRMNYLKTEFINKALMEKKPIITEIVNSYNSFSYQNKDNRFMNIKTPLCDVKINRRYLL